MNDNRLDFFYPDEKRFGAIRSPHVPFVAEIPFVDPSYLFERLPRARGDASILLESSRVSAGQGRWSLILLEPFARFRSFGRHCLLSRNGRIEETLADPLSMLRRLAREHAIERPAELPPFVGGFAGIFNYEFKNQIEAPAEPVYDLYGFPDVDLGLYGKGVAFDHAEERAYAFRLHPRLKSWAEGAAEIESWRAEIADACEAAPRSAQPAAIGDVETGQNKLEFMRRAAKAKEYIRQGDVFQVNLSHCLEFRYPGDPFSLYKAQREVNPTSFAAFADFGTYQLICGSPERLVRVRGREVSTRPIAGTRPRSADAVEDERLSAELLLSPKERAEHVMLIDLERNDLGRVSEYGSVQVDELMTIENYSHVRHIVSNVRGLLRPECDAFDALRAVFPGGTITGAPKVRAMQIIDELEGRARGPYTGSLGYIGFDGDCDLNIVIRTLVLKGESAYLSVGAGIVADSDPEREYGETIDKAKALLKALRIEGPRTARLVAVG